MNHLSIKPATLDHLEVVASLFDAYRQFYEQASDITVARDFIAQRMVAQESVILLAYYQEQAVGFCQLYPVFCSIEAKRTYLLSDLFVNSTHRGLGIGRGLLQQAEAFALATDRVKMELTTAHTNTTAQALYESLGWVRDEVFRGYSKRVVAA